MDHAAEIEFHIREKTFVARVAAFFMKGQKVAIVLGNTIYLHGTKEAEFLETIHWLRHELMHVWQYRQQGTFLFLIKYGWESLQKGYWNNPYEIEAREAEGIIDFEKKFKVVSRRRSG
jgi:hypothetical protein